MSMSELSRWNKTKLTITITAFSTVIALFFFGIIGKSGKTPKQDEPGGPNSQICETRLEQCESKLEQTEGWLNGCGLSSDPLPKACPVTNQELEECQSHVATLIKKCPLKSKSEPSQ